MIAGVGEVRLRYMSQALLSNMLEVPLHSYDVEVTLGVT